MSGYPSLDVLHQFAGPCLICGGPDKRHRLADALVEAVGAGDSPEFVAESWDVPVTTVEALVATRQENRRRHKYRWGGLRPELVKGAEK